MALSGRVFEALTAAIKLTDSVKNMSADIKEIDREIKELDKRLIRVETYLEIAEKSRMMKLSSKE